jgi:hypothetical protein
MTRPAFDAAWQQVTCRTCKRTYTCTPEDDYYGEPGGGRPGSATSGVCFGCMLKRGGMNPDATPVQVIDLTGMGTDPRDLSQGPAGGTS